MAYNKRIPFGTVDKVNHTHISMKLVRYLYEDTTYTDINNFGEENVLVSPVYSVAGHK